MFDKTIAVWTASLSAPKPCADPRCKALIVWGQIAASGRRMCFTVPVEPVAVFRDGASGHSVTVMPFASNHWASCPGARDRFKNKPIISKPPEPQGDLF